MAEQDGNKDQDRDTFKGQKVQPENKPNSQEEEDEEDDNLTYDQQMRKHFSGRSPAPLIYKFICDQGFQLGEEIGKGSYSTVYKATWTELPNVELACKRISIEDVNEEWKSKCLNRELKIVNRIKYKYIVEVFKTIKTKRLVFIFMRMAANGSLKEHMTRKGKPIRCANAILYFNMLMMAVSFIHGKGVAHRDLKLDNLLLDHQNNILLADFGLSVYGNSGNEPLMQATLCGSYDYIAPEVHKAENAPYDAKRADLYSAGVCLFEMVNYERPFSATEDMDLLLRQKMDRQYRYHKKLEPLISNEAKDMIHKLLDPNPNTRLTIKGIGKHPAMN